MSFRLSGGNSDETSLLRIEVLDEVSSLDGAVVINPALRATILYGHLRIMCRATKLI